MLVVFATQGWEEQNILDVHIALSTSLTTTATERTRTVLDRSLHDPQTTTFKRRKN